MNRHNNIHSALRITCILMLVILGMTGLMIEPTDGCTYWLVVLILSKGIGASAIYATWALASRWVETDRWLQLYRQWCEKGIEDVL